MKLSLSRILHSYPDPHPTCTSFLQVYLLESQRWELGWLKQPFVLGLRGSVFAFMCHIPSSPQDDRLPTLVSAEIVSVYSGSSCGVHTTAPCFVSVVQIKPSFSSARALSANLQALLTGAKKSWSFFHSSLKPCVTRCLLTPLVCCPHLWAARILPGVCWEGSGCLQRFHSNLTPCF